ncbi:MAG: hypothetical protein WB791_08585 [Waddliaceae bacterium]
MKRTILLAFFFFIGSLAYFLFIAKTTKNPEYQLKEAYREYVKGEKAGTAGERRAAFNRALSLYTDLEREPPPAFGNGKLYYNIANSYFQLGQYPWAVYYYYRALALMPRNDKVVHNLSVALNKLDLRAGEEQLIFSRIFPFHHYLSLPERLQVFFGLGLLTLVLGSLYLWSRRSWLRKTAILTAVLTGVMLLSLGYSHYIAPIEGVIIRSTALYRDAGEQYAKVRDAPILSGSRVEVLDVLREGRWLKVMTEKGDLGYIPHDSIRIL